MKNSTILERKGRIGGGEGGERVTSVPWHARTSEETSLANSDGGRGGLFGRPLGWCGCARTEVCDGALSHRSFMQVRSMCLQAIAKYALRM